MREFPCVHLHYYWNSSLTTIIMEYYIVQYADVSIMVVEFAFTLV